jgi:hypothetical protein
VEEWEGMVLVVVVKSMVADDEGCKMVRGGRRKK